MDFYSNEAPWVHDCNFEILFQTVNHPSQQGFAMADDEV